MAAKPKADTVRRHWFVESAKLLGSGQERESLEAKLAKITEAKPVALGLSEKCPS